MTETTSRSIARKLASVRMVRGILDAHDNGEAPAAVMARARSLRPAHEHCATGFMCYYPEVVSRASEAAQPLCDGRAAGAQ